MFLLFSYYSHQPSYDQSSAPVDQYSQGYSAPPPATGYSSNGYSSHSGYAQPPASGYAPSTEYDSSQYQQDYR